MANPFVAEIRIFGFNFAPTGWALCNGQLMALSQNTALFSLLGTNYGGDGKTTFGLPNLQGMVPLGQGQGPGLSPYFVGQSGGEAAVTLLTNQLPSHSHAAQGASGIGVENPSGAAWGSALKGAGSLYGAPGTLAQMAGASLANAGGSQPHNNLPPYLVLNYCIALQGVFPARS